MVFTEHTRMRRQVEQLTLCGPAVDHPRARVMDQIARILSGNSEIAALERVNGVILGIAAREEIENGRKARIDSTVVESNIHVPSDSACCTTGCGYLRGYRRFAASALGAWRNHTPSAEARMREIHSPLLFGTLRVCSTRHDS